MKNQSAVELGKMKSTRKAVASRVNGKRGGRPKGSKDKRKRVKSYPQISLTNKIGSYIIKVLKGREI